MLEVEYADPDLERLEKDPSFTGGFDEAVVKRFRITMQIIRTVSKKNQLFQYNSLRLKKFDREWRIWLNKKWRLMVEFLGEEPNETIRILEINNHYGDNG